MATTKKASTKKAAAKKTPKKGDTTDPQTEKAIATKTDQERKEASGAEPGDPMNLPPAHGDGKEVPDSEISKGPELTSPDTERDPETGKLVEDEPAPPAGEQQGPNPDAKAKKAPAKRRAPAKGKTDEEKEASEQAANGRIEVSPSRPIENELVDITGSGFPPNKPAKVRVTPGGLPTSAAQRTDPLGQVQVSVYARQGEHQVEIEVEGQSVSTTFTAR